MKNIKIRKSEEENYYAIWANGKTLRFYINPNMPIKNLKYPEFYDIKITNKCSGNCSYCYQDSGIENYLYKNSLSNLKSIFDNMDKNNKPFQIALGGGNPNEHPDFINIIKYLYDSDICPNYTTNGYGLTENILKASKEYCGGVAVTCHKHLEDIWKPAINSLLRHNIMTNVHIIIDDKESIDYFNMIYKEYNKIISYFVLLPYISNVGRSSKKNINYQYLEKILLSYGNIENVAFGAHFYEWLKGTKFDVNLYEPEIMSKYIDLKDLNVYASSFERNPIGIVKNGEIIYNKEII